ncbi:MAG: dCTP deaminase [Candidatus Uhrbacteria bacterium]|nr:dCTP deaminase [Candidatus Uhrbacteria bacterium]
MALSDKTIREYLEKEIIVITPLAEHAIRSASVDLTLGNHFLTVDSNAMEIIRLDSPVVYREITADSITIPPHSFILATTQEYIKVPPTLTAAVEGRSSIGRLGLFIQNAGWIDPGFEGNITLELYNANSLPIRLDAGRRLCQVVFYEMDQEVENPYHGKYKGQQGTTGSRIFSDPEVAPDVTDY